MSKKKEVKQQYSSKRRRYIEHETPTRPGWFEIECPFCCERTKVELTFHGKLCSGCGATHHRSGYTIKFSEVCENDNGKEST